jgi:hypothetical protein
VGQVAGQRGQAQAALMARGGLEDRGLAGARRAHQVDRQDARGREVFTVVPRARVVVAEDAPLDLQRHDVGIATATVGAHQGPP